MPLSIQGFIIGYLELPVSLGRNAGRNSFFQQAIPEPIGVITAVRQKVFGGGEISQQFSGALVIRYLTCRQMHQNGSSLIIANSVQFGIQHAFCAANSAGNAPFLSKLEAVRCALRCVASICNCSGTSCDDNSLNILSNTPILLQRIKRL